MTKPIAVALSALLSFTQAAVADETPGQQRSVEAYEARGYKQRSVRRLLSRLQAPPVGSKRVVVALYQVFGQYETLTTMPSKNPFDGVPRIPLLTDEAPRDVRKRLLTPLCRVAFCKGVFLGRTAPCTIPRSFYGDTYRTTCFVIEEMW